MITKTKQYELIEKFIDEIPQGCRVQECGNLIQLSKGIEYAYYFPKDKLWRTSSSALAELIDETWKVLVVLDTEGQVNAYVGNC